ncbi:MAG: YdcF family protein [Phycisphaeraceae bacterium]|nr:YdcF family protein [Phycisphaeraceae bacterium]
MVKAAKKRTPLRLAIRLAFYTGVIGLTGILLHLGVIIYTGCNDDTRPRDVGVVLGNYVSPEGVVGSVVKGRLDRAIELYNAEAFHHIIVSGSTAPGGYNEARGMREYLIAHGIPQDVIIADPNGINTYFTARNTREILRQHNWTSAIAISQYYHILRCRLAFRRMGISDVGSAHAPEGREMREPFILCREFVAFYWYLIREYPDVTDQLSGLPVSR